MSNQIVSNVSYPVTPGTTVLLSIDCHLAASGGQPPGAGLFCDVRLPGDEQVDAAGDRHAHAEGRHQPELDGSEDGGHIWFLRDNAHYDREFQHAPEVEGEVADGFGDERLVGGVPCVLVIDDVRDGGYQPDHDGERLDERQGQLGGLAVVRGRGNGGHALQDPEGGDREGEVGVPRVGLDIDQCRVVG